MEGNVITGAITVYPAEFNSRPSRLMLVDKSRVISNIIASKSICLDGQLRVHQFQSHYIKGEDVLVALRYQCAVRYQDQ